MGLLSWLLGTSKDDYDDEYYADMYELYHGKRPNHKLTDDEKCELDELEDEDWDEDEEDRC